MNKKIVIVVLTNWGGIIDLKNIKEQNLKRVEDFRIDKIIKEFREIL